MSYVLILHECQGHKYSVHSRVYYTRFSIHVMTSILDDIYNMQCLYIEYV